MKEQRGTLEVWIIPIVSFLPLFVVACLFLLIEAPHRFLEFSSLQYQWYYISFLFFLLLDLISLIMMNVSKSIQNKMIALAGLIVFPILLWNITSGSLPIIALIYLASILAIGNIPFIPLQLVSFGLVLGSAVNHYLHPIGDNFFDVEPGGLSQLEFFTLFFILLVCSLLLFIGSFNEKRYRMVKERLIHEKSTNRQLASFNTRLQTYAKQSKEESIVNERNRITREMHDVNGYAFTNIMALMNAAISSGNKDWGTIECLLRNAWKQAHQGLQDSRRTLRILRSTIKENDSLSIYQSVGDVVRIFKECTGTDVLLHWGNLQITYGHGINIAISRIIQEGLVNSVRHGRATQVTIYFWEQHHILNLIISDNGVGSPTVVKGIGMSGMEERLAPYNGSVGFENASEGGFKLFITLPLQQSVEVVKSGGDNDYDSDR